MRPCMRGVAVVLASLVASLAVALAGTAGYVDCVNGSDENDGLSPATAWRTINYGIAQLGSGTLNVAEGTCANEGGIRLMPFIELQGAGVGRTIIDDRLDLGRAWSVVVSDLTFGGGGVDDDGGFQLTLRRVESGARIETLSEDFYVVVEDSRLAGFYFGAQDYGTFTMRRSTVTGDATLYLDTNGSPRADIEDSRFGGSLTIDAGGSGSPVIGYIVRNTLAGGLSIRGADFGCVPDPLIVGGNVVAGIVAEPMAACSLVPGIEIVENTVLDRGLDLKGASFRAVGNIIVGPMFVRYSINLGVNGNAFGPASSYCLDGQCTTDPGAIGVGNAFGDPLFVDATAGNYRLRGESAFIDFVPDAWRIPVGSDTDRDGRERPIDVKHRGDGRTYDAGAYEFAEPLAVHCGEATVSNRPGECEAPVDCTAIATCAGDGAHAASLTCNPASPYTVGSTSTTATCATAAATASASCTVTVRDVEAPHGAITSPAAGACFGPTSVPVVVTDSFADNCAGELSRSYIPAGGPGYAQHGDYHVAETVTDAAGNQGTGSTAFTIDLVPPKVTLLASHANWLLTPQLSFSRLFADSDDDGASGGVVHETLSLDGCVLYDGSTYGNRDGLLRDETLPGTQEEMCRLVRRCGKRQCNNPVIAITATDCGGNSTTATTVLAGSIQVPSGVCR